MIIIIIIIIILFYLWRRRAPQLLLPDSSSSPPLSLSPSVSAGRSWNPPARPEREQGGKGGDGGDQRPRDHARAVTAAASRAPSPRSTSNNPAARGSGTLVRRRPPGPGACAGARRARSPGQVCGAPRGARWGVRHPVSSLPSGATARAHAREALWVVFCFVFFASLSFPLHLVSFHHPPTPTDPD